MYIGGDTDTLGAIAGAVAEAFWGITVLMTAKAKEYLPEDMQTVLKRIYKEINGSEDK